MITLRELKLSGESILKENGIEDCGFDSMELLLSAFGISRNEYYLISDREVSEKEKNEYYKLISRRAAKEPLQYILGKWNFYESEFFVGDGVLIPRPETEDLVNICIEAVKKNNYNTVFDLCAGSGCIGLSIAKACPEVQCFLFELYDDALYYTRKNAQSLKLSNAFVIKHDILKGCPDNLPSCDLLVSNPPYIPHDEIKDLQTEVLREPMSALDGGHDGLDFYRAVKNKWCRSISDGGFIAFECAENQCDDIVSLFSDEFLCEGKNDVFGLGRFVTGEKR